jgi:outer membrane protein
MMRFVVLLAIAALGGCALMGSTDPYPVKALDSMPSAAREVLDTRAKGPAGAGAGITLGLDEAIAIAMAGNPGVAAADWEGEAALARRDVAAAERWPRFGLVGGYTRHLDEQRLLPVRQPGDPTVLSRDIVSGDLLLSLPLMTGGRLQNQIQGAELLAQASRHRLARTREELVFNVSSLFYAILAQEKVIESLEFARRTMQEQLRRIDALIAAQKAAGVDRLRSEVRLADVDQRLARERSRLAIQRRAFIHLLGVEEEADSLSLRGELLDAKERELPDQQAAIEMALSQRADCLAARAALEARARSVDAARAAYWPTLFLQGSYGARWAVGSWIGEGQELDDAGRIGLVLEMPIFEGGRTAAQVREQRALLAADREHLRRMELAVRLEVETALLSVASTRERAAVLAKGIEQASEGLRIEREKYALGKGTIGDVLDAQAALLESQTSYFLVLAELQTALAQLRLAGGEGSTGESS